ncbi:hypothetical protein ASA1KI_30960 [Opitutales bacterium ASA1]|uniref:hypothetical protein n=1 Tax=Congregicoccus parvus TaxID=3081749 RepID=UPI002B2CFE59|nr:hypothetical protein ASA1KI_30960 [Opitutales bacterium ASA1]
MARLSPRAKTILLSVAATLLIVLILQNWRSATVRFVVWEASMPLALLVLFSAGAGWLSHWIWRGR